MSDWTNQADANRAAQEEARVQLQRAGQRRRAAIKELYDAREALLALATEIADSKLLPKSQIAEAADISRNKLYGNGNTS